MTITGITHKDIAEMLEPQGQTGSRQRKKQVYILEEGAGDSETCTWSTVGCSQ